MGDANQGLNDIKVVYHPSSGRQTDIYTFEYYCNGPDSEATALNSSTATPLNSDKRPWAPFPTRTDFELAEVMLDGHLNRQQINRILTVFRKANPTDSNNNSEVSDNRLTIQNAADLTHIWDQALKTRATGVRDSMQLISTYNTHNSIFSNSLRRSPSP